jgi:hypothetical protein
MKPTFRHRRPATNVTPIAKNCNRLFSPVLIHPARFDFFSQAISPVICQPRQRGLSDWHSEAPAGPLNQKIVKTYSTIPILLKNLGLLF